jgi:hypothetical protein
MAHTHVVGKEVSSDIVSVSEAALILGINPSSIYLMKNRGLISSVAQIDRGRRAWRNSCVQGFSLQEIRAVLNSGKITGAWINTFPSFTQTPVKKPAKAPDFQELNLEDMNDDQLWSLINS